MGSGELQSVKTLHVRIKESSHWEYIDKRIRKSVNSALVNVDNRMQEVILRAMLKVVNARVQMVERVQRLTTESSGRGPISLVQNRDQSDSTGSTENALLMPAATQLVLNFDQDISDVTCNIENLEVGYNPAVGTVFDRRALAQYIVIGHNAPQNKNLELLTGRITIQNNPLAQYSTRPQNMATHLSPHNTLPMVEQTPRRRNSVKSNPINRLSEAIESFVSQQWPQMTSKQKIPRMYQLIKLEKAIHDLVQILSTRLLTNEDLAST